MKVIAFLLTFSIFNHAQARSVELTPHIVVRSMEYTDSNVKMELAIGYNSSMCALDVESILVESSNLGHNGESTVKVATSRDPFRICLTAYGPHSLSLNLPVDTANHGLPYLQKTQVYKVYVDDVYATEINFN
jgi:hypothetical protein